MGAYATSEFDPVSTAFLVIEKLSSNGVPVWSVQWRSMNDDRVKRRLGFAAWVTREGKAWKQRAGRPPEGYLTEFQARRRMPEFVRAIEAELAAERERLAAPMPSSATFRELAHAWLEYIADVEDAKPATLRDYRAMLAEPGTRYKRSKGVAIGRIMAALGDMPPTEVGATDIEKLLARHAKENVGARSVNKHRQVISAIFNYGLRGGRWNLVANPVATVAKRKEPPPGRLEVFTVEQIEEMARVAASGTWRDPAMQTDENAPIHAAEDAQLAELLRIAAYTGPRRGELLTLR